MIIWCAVPEIWSVMDRIFCYFGPFFCPFTPLTTGKINILKNWKKVWRYYHFTYVYRKGRSYVWFLRYRAWRTERIVILDHFLPFYPKNLKKWKKTKKHWRYHFIHVYHKWQSYNVCFLRYGTWRTKSFVILDRFLPFYPPNNPRTQSFEKMKKDAWRYFHFTYMYINCNHMCGFWDMERDRQKRVGDFC